MLVGGGLISQRFVGRNLTLKTTQIPHRVVFPQIRRNGPGFSSIINFVTILAQKTKRLCLCSYFDRILCEFAEIRKRRKFQKKKFS